MELLDKGKHCQEEYCHQLDLLPTKCKACGNFYCHHHIHYDAHRCQEVDKLDFKVPTCELCHETIEFRRGKDMDLCLAEHMFKCQLRISNSRKTTVEKKKPSVCQFKDCKSKDLFKLECERCGEKFCKNHRLPEDHKCEKLYGPTTAAASCSQQFLQPPNNNKSSAKSKNKSNFFTISSY